MGLHNTGCLLSKSVPFFFKSAESKNTSPWAPTLLLQPELFWDGKFQKQCWDNPTLFLAFRGAMERPCVFSMQLFGFFFCHSSFFPSPFVSEISRNGGKKERNKPFKVPTKRILDAFSEFRKHPHHQMFWIHSCPLKLYLNPGKSGGSPRAQWLQRPLLVTTPPLPPRSGQATGWLVTQRCRACEETKMGVGVGLCWPGMGAVPWAASTSLPPGDALGQGSSPPFKACPPEPLHEWIWDAGSITFLGSESHAVQFWEVRAWSLLIWHSSEGSASLRVSSRTTGLPRDSPGYYHQRTQRVLAPSPSKSFQLCRPFLFEMLAPGSGQ